MLNQAMLGCAGVPEVDVVAFEQLLRVYTAFEVGGALSGTANLEQVC